MMDRTLLSATDHQPRVGDWLQAANGTALQVMGPCPDNSSMIPCQAQGQAEPVLLPRRVLTWPPIPAPPAAAPAPAGARAAPAAAPAAASARPAVATPPAAPAAAAPAPAPAASAPSADADLARLEPNMMRTAALARARNVAMRVHAVWQAAADSGRPITLVEAAARVDHQLRTERAAKH